MVQKGETEDLDRIDVREKKDKKKKILRRGGWVGHVAGEQLLVSRSQKGMVKEGSPYALV